jgi:hypothetical protein
MGRKAEDAAMPEKVIMTEDAVAPEKAEKR